MKQILFPVVVGLSLTGLVACLPADEAPDADACGALALQDLVGQPEAALDGADLPEWVRVIHPGDMVTMDYLPARLNVDIGSDGRIARLHCG